MTPKLLFFEPVMGFKTGCEEVEHFSKFARLDLPDGYSQNQNRPTAISSPVAQLV
jgi:hypothetical protein